jgi:hypothetical protein
MYNLEMFGKPQELAPRARRFTPLMPRPEA